MGKCLIEKAHATTWTLCCGLGWCIWAAAVAKLLLVRFIAEGREVIRRLPVRKEGAASPQKLAVNAPRGRQARGQKRQQPIASIQLPVVADLANTLSKSSTSTIRAEIDNMYSLIHVRTKAKRQSTSPFPCFSTKKLRKMSHKNLANHWACQYPECS